MSRVFSKKKFCENFPRREQERILKSKEFLIRSLFFLVGPGGRPAPESSVSRRGWFSSGTGFDRNSCQGRAFGFQSDRTTKKKSPGCNATKAVDGSNQGFKSNSTKRSWAIFFVEFVEEMTVEKVEVSVVMRDLYEYLWTLWRSLRRGRPWGQPRWV
jgi:hypothetical protein